MGERVSLWTRPVLGFKSPLNLRAFWLNPGHRGTDTLLCVLSLYPNHRGHEHTFWMPLNLRVASLQAQELTWCQEQNSSCFVEAHHTLVPRGGPRCA